jgi:hypothetical protein
LRTDEILRPVGLEERPLVAAKNMPSPPRDCQLEADSSSSAVLSSFPISVGGISPPHIEPIDARHFRTDEALLDMQSALLIENIRQTLTIHTEMFRRTLEATPSPSLLLAELLVETGNRYLDFSKLVSTLCMRLPMRKA